MNPDIPQEVRIVNAIAEQLFDVWPVSIVMIDLEDRIWRMNKQMSDELQQDADIIGKKWCRTERTSCPVTYRICMKAVRALSTCLPIASCLNQRDILVFLYKVL